MSMATCANTRVETPVENYGGAVRVGDNHPEGSVFVVELQTG